MVARYAVAVVVFVPLREAYGFYQTRLATAWRGWLAGRALRLYFAHKVRAVGPVFFRAGIQRSKPLLQVVRRLPTDRKFRTSLRQLICSQSVFAGLLRARSEGPR